MKGIFFRLLLAFQTTSFGHILKLVQYKYNAQNHSGLFGFNPFQTHFSTHVTSQVSRLNSLAFRRHQNDAISLHLNTPSGQRIVIGSKVKVRKQRHVFRKETPLFHSIWSENVYIVKEIDKTSFPFLYHLRGLSKVFYSFQLLLLTVDFPIDDLKTSSKTRKIHVIDFVQSNSPYLRSGKTIPSRHEIKYRIRKDGQTNLVPPSDLLLFKRLYGKHVLHYADIFKQPANLQYVI